jgi:hypothetical protein
LPPSFHLYGLARALDLISPQAWTQTPITARTWSRYGIPAMLATCVKASIFFALLYPYLSR